MFELMREGKERAGERMTTACLTLLFHISTRVNSLKSLCKSNCLFLHGIDSEN